jgi:nucleotide-binding universal stress UspA family protein
MNTSAAPVVLGIDRSPWADAKAAMQFAVREARLRNVALHVVHGGAPRHLLTPPGWSALRRPTLAGRQSVELVARQLRRISQREVAVITVNSAASGIEALLEASTSASLLVLQSRGRGSWGRVGGLGSTSRVVAARAACPVVVVRGRRPAEPGAGVVVGLEEHGRGQVALETAMAAAAYRSVPLTAVLAWDAPPTTAGGRAYMPTSAEVSAALRSAQLLMSEALAGLADDVPDIELRRRLVRGPVVEVLRDAARHADLLVVGRRSNSGLSGYALGHAGRALLQDAPCPLMLVAAAEAPRTGTLSTVLAATVPVGAGY